jgi:polyphosphate glucokinase
VFNYDHLYVGGGNSTRINFALPPNASIVDNKDGMAGGAFVWAPKNGVRKPAG